MRRASATDLSLTDRCDRSQNFTLGYLTINHREKAIPSVSCLPGREENPLITCSRPPSERIKLANPTRNACSAAKKKKKNFLRTPHTVRSILHHIAGRMFCSGFLSAQRSSCAFRSFQRFGGRSAMMGGWGDAVQCSVCDMRTWSARCRDGFPTMSAVR